MENKNTEAFIQLIRTYKAITKQEIDNEDAQHAFPQWDWGEKIMRNRTGFSSPALCTLCVSASHISDSEDFETRCQACIWTVNDETHACLNDNYDAICYSRNADELLEKLQERIILMEKRLEELNITF